MERRQKQILDLLARDGHESIEALARTIGVSSMTIRRDLARLEEQGQLRRIHGGAVAVSEDQVGEVSLDYRIRQRQNATAKRQIAVAAAALVHDGEVIFMDAGTTVLAMAEHLVDRRDLTVVTHSLPVAEKLSGRAGITVFLLGGLVRRDLLAMVGHQTEELLASYRLDRAFLGTGGIDPIRGLTYSNLEEIPIKRLAARLAGQAVVLADQSKFGRVGFLYYLPVEEFHLLITDGPDGIDMRPAGASIARQTEAPALPKQTTSQTHVAPPPPTRKTSVAGRKRPASLRKK